jgi:hypothetical protein
MKKSRGTPLGSANRMSASHGSRTYPKPLGYLSTILWQSLKVSSCVQCRVVLPNALHQCFSTFVRPRPGKFFF